MMTELADGLIMWALLNVVFVFLFLLGGWRRERSVRMSRSSNPPVSESIRRRDFALKRR